MTKHPSSSPSLSSCGCGCFGFFSAFFFMWSLWIGLPTPWGILNIDIFPPAIRLINANPNARMK